MGNHEIRIHTPLDSDEYILYNELAQANPFRYRSYYFDTETGFYYLPARYYDPTCGRFISPDGVANLNPSVHVGLNLYLYAGNDPVNGVYGGANSGAGGSAENETIISQNSGALFNTRFNNSSKWRFDPSFITRAFGFIENGFSVVEGVIDGYRRVQHLPKIESLRKTSIKLMHIGMALGLAADAYNNFSNENLTRREQWISFVVDGLYTVGSTAISYGVSLGATAFFGTLLGVSAPVALIAAIFTIAASFIIDQLVEEYGVLDSIKDWIESW